MFVTAEDFNVVPYNLVHLEEVENDFDVFVNANEEEVLKKVFGYLFYKAFVAGLTALPAEYVTLTAYATDDLVTYGSNIFKALVDVPNTNTDVPVDGATWQVQAANRWLILREGADYTYNEVDYRWVGMAELCKGFIYALWTQWNTDAPSGAGIVTLDTENGATTSPGIRIANGWNRSATIIGGYRNRWTHVGDTLYGYLVTNATTFDDLVAGITRYPNFLSYLSQEFKNPGGRNIFDL